MYLSVYKCIQDKISTRCRQDKRSHQKTSALGNWGGGLAGRGRVDGMYESMNE